MRRITFITCLSSLLTLSALPQGASATETSSQQTTQQESNMTHLNNQEIIALTYEGKDSSENAANLQRYLAEDVVWTEAAGFPYAGTYIGFSNIAKVFQQLESEWIDYRFTVEGYVASGDNVMAYGTYTGTFKATNKSFRARVTHLWTLKNQKVTSFEQFVDSKPVNDAMLP